MASPYAYSAPDAVRTRPEQVVTAMGEQDVRALLGLITDRVYAAVRELARYL